MPTHRRYEIKQTPDGHIWERKTKAGNVAERATKKHPKHEDAYYEAERLGVESGADFVVLSPGCDQPWAAAEAPDSIRAR